MLRSKSTLTFFCWALIAFYKEPKHISMAALPEIYSHREPPPTVNNRRRNSRLSFDPEEISEEAHGPLSGVVDPSQNIKHTSHRLVQSARDCATAYFAERDEAQFLLSEGLTRSRFDREEQRRSRRATKQRAKERFTVANRRAHGLVHLPGWMDAGATMDTFSEGQRRLPTQLPPIGPHQTQRTPPVDDSPLAQLQSALARHMHPLAEVFRSWGIEIGAAGATVSCHELLDAVQLLRLDGGEGWGIVGVKSLIATLGLCMLEPNRAPVLASLSPLLMIADALLMPWRRAPPVVSHDLELSPTISLDLPWQASTRAPTSSGEHCGWRSAAPTTSMTGRRSRRPSARLRRWRRTCRIASPTRCTRPPSRSASNASSATCARCSQSSTAASSMSSVRGASTRYALSRPPCAH